MIKIWVNELEEMTWSILEKTAPEVSLGLHPLQTLHGYNGYSNLAIRVESRAHPG